MTTLLAYHNDPKIKRKYMRRVAAHRKADELIQGATEGRCEDGSFRGCAVACTFETYDHTRGPDEIGVPDVLMHLEDAIFEGLDKDAALQWPTRFLKAIHVGADLSLVCAQFAVWNLTDKKFGAISLPDQPTEAIDCCHRVAALWQRVINGESQTSLIAEFKKEEARAWAWTRAWTRARAWAGAGTGAWTRAWTRAWAWAGADYWPACADKLEELLKAAPVK